MKLYRKYVDSSISMHADAEMNRLLQEVIGDLRIDHVLETGTYDGLGSTSFIARSFRPQTPPVRFLTIEANWVTWQRARRNLAQFPFVEPLWGNTVNEPEALAFIAADDALIDHSSNTQIFIDDIQDPRLFYSNEVRGLLGTRRLQFAHNALAALQRSFGYYHGDDLLRKYLGHFRDKHPLIVLDSAGGIGLLEFSIVNNLLFQDRYLLLLDDIHHIKHYRSLEQMQCNDAFVILGVDHDFGWALAEHTPEPEVHHSRTS